MLHAIVALSALVPVERAWILPRAPPTPGRGGWRADVPRMADLSPPSPFGKGDVSREQLLDDLATYESEVKAQAVRDAAFTAGGPTSTVFAAGSAVALIAGARAALVSSRLERERQQLEDERSSIASPGRRSLVGGVATGLAGAALGTLFGRAVNGDEAASEPDPALVAKLEQSEAARAAAETKLAESKLAAQQARARAPSPPAGAGKALTEAQARAAAAEARASAAEV